MSQNLRVTDSIDRQKWEDFVLNHPNGNIFQTPEMHEVYRRTKNYEPIALAVLDESNEIVALTQAVVIKEIGGPLGIFSARAVMHGGPLYVEGDVGKEAVQVLMEQYNSTTGKKALYTHIRNMWDISEIFNLLKTVGYEYEEHLNFLINLNKSRDELWNNLYKSRRNGISKSYRLGTIIEEVQDINLMPQIYDVLEETYSHAKLPLADITLFESAFAVLGPKNMVRYWVAKDHDKIVGVILTLVYQDVIFDWYAGASRDALKLYPNDVLPWYAIEWGCNNKLNIFDFGGAGKPDEEYGVRDFKKQFGGNLVHFGRCKLVHNKIKTKIAENGFKLYRNCISKKVT